MKKLVLTLFTMCELVGIAISFKMMRRLNRKIAVFSSLVRIGSRIAAHTPPAYYVVIFYENWNLF